MTAAISFQLGRGFAEAHAAPTGPVSGKRWITLESNLMVAPQHEDEAGLSFTQSNTEPRSKLPWVIAGVVILLVAGVLTIFGGHRSADAGAGGLGVAPVDPYATNLLLNQIKMSEAINFVGGKVTYLDGQIMNNGDKTLAGVTVQVVFRNELKEIAQKETMPLSLIRTREPYVDTQPISVAPIKPGERQEFRLIFDNVASDWNQQYPEIRVIRVTTR
jgi:hypothetical protein